MRFVEPRKHLAPYFPFGLGPNYCVGQNLALFEMKIVLVMVLQRYSFVVSPTYAPSMVESNTLQEIFPIPYLDPSPSLQESELTVDSTIDHRYSWQSST